MRQSIHSLRPARWLPLAGALSIALTAACGDDPAGRPIGSSCDAPTDCASGLCYAGSCLDPEGDDDGDGLTNGLEAAQGTNPKLADSDGDGKPDGDEYDGATARDDDGDGVVDALESTTEDEDADCIPDEGDPRNTVPDPSDAALVAAHCEDVGVCVAEGATLAVRCPDGLDAPVCHYAGVANHEADETTCDRLDNDCDGETDEGCDPLSRGLIGHWKLDGDGQDSGPHADHGDVFGAEAAPDRFGNPGKALRFSTAGDRVAVAATEHPIGEVTATYTAWIRPDRAAPVPYMGVLNFGDALETNRRSSLVVDSAEGCANYVGENNDVAAGLACAPPGHWSFVSVVKTGRTVRFYLDGRPLDTAETAEGQDLVSTALVIGLSRYEGTDSVYEPFHGVIDDVRVYGRALDDAELASLFTEGGWGATGSAANPAKHCTHVRDAAGSPSGTYTLDVDGDGPRQPFSAYCDMDLDGGGWTLAWVYGFTAPDPFDGDANAVTPRPSWPVLDADVAVSTTPPASPSTPGAIDWALWRELGAAFAVVSDLNDGVACEPGRGSLVDGFDGNVDCRMVKDVTSTCDGVVPRHLGFGPYGPSLSADELYYYFDGNTSDNWPTHDPCGQNSTQHVAAPERWGGAIYLRRATRRVRYPGQCSGYWGLARVNGPKLIDPDGDSGAEPFEVECRFDLERGGWTELSPRMRDALQARGDAPVEYFLSKDDAFYRSPVTTALWSWEVFEEVVGDWFFGGPSTGDGVFGCAGGGEGDHGVGCGPIPSGIASATLPRMLTDAGGADAAAATTRVCDNPPGAFGAASGECTDDVSVWVRARSCMPDDGSLLGDGGFSQVTFDEERGWRSPCWYIGGPNGFMDATALDMEEIPPGGSAPSLRAENPELGNDIWVVGASQRDFSVIAGRSYTLGFWAKAAETRSIRIFVQPTTYDFAIYYEDITLSPEWRYYSFGFAAPRTFWSTTLDFQLAETSTATVWLDDISITDDGPSPCGMGDAGNLIGNGDFSAGRTCWRFGNHIAGRFAGAQVVEDAGPEAQPALVVELFGAPSESWHAAVYRQGIPLEAGRHYRISYTARATSPGGFYMNLQRWDLGVESWFSMRAPIGTTWRTYSFDFIAPTDTPSDGATLQFDLGGLGEGQFVLDDVRLEALGAPDCGATIFTVPSFFAGLACWTPEWHWDELDLYVEPDGDDTVRFEITDNNGGFDYTARLGRPNVPLIAGHGYALRFEARAETPRRGYANVQGDAGLFANSPVQLDTTSRPFETAWVQPVNAAASLEIGIGGPLATGLTWISRVWIEHLGADPCADRPNGVANGDFAKSHVCWDVSRPWDEVRLDATTDNTTSGAASPSVRLDYAPITASAGAYFQQRGFFWNSGLTYEVSFAVRANVETSLMVSSWQENGPGFIGEPVPVTPTWTTQTVFFAPSVTADGDGVLAFGFENMDGPVTVWLDDVKVTISMPQ